MNWKQQIKLKCICTYYVKWFQNKLFSLYRKIYTEIVIVFSMSKVPLEGKKFLSLHICVPWNNDIFVLQCPFYRVRNFIWYIFLIVYWARVLAVCTTILFSVVLDTNIQDISTLYSICTSSIVGYRVLCTSKCVNDNQYQ